MTPTPLPHAFRAPLGFRTQRPRGHGRIHLCAVVLFVALGVLGSRSAAAADEELSVGPAARNASPRQLETVRNELSEAQKRHAAQLDSISREFAELNLMADVEACQALSAPIATAMFRLPKLPQGVRPPLFPDLPERERTVRLSLRKAEDDFATDLYRIARRALSAGYPSFAYQLVQEVVRHNSDHPPARRILGYRLRAKQWLTPFAADRLDKGYVWDDTFGWLKKENVDRYRAGRRLCAGRWMSAQKEAEIRRDFRQAWRVETDHYLVKTNHSQERGVEIAKALEDYHNFFLQTFPAFFNKPEQIRFLFEAAGTGPKTHGKYVVHYFRTRDEYVRRLVGKVPQIAITNGLYYTADHVAYFFDDPEKLHLDTLFHEATHQLLYESVPGDRMVAMNANFWIIEGIACYMESYHADNGQCMVGDARHPRIEAARHRRVVDRYYVPLQDFAAMGMREFQASRDISKNYSQAAGLAHFFMHFQGGRYREALVEHLAELYRASPAPHGFVRSLADLTGTSFPELDREYEAYMAALKDRVSQSTADR